MPFTLYVALGDSMSTDHYPTCDVRNLDAPPGRLDPLGAAALLHSNDDARWPEFRGRDLARLHPGIVFLNLAEDGAMIDDVATEELSRLGRDSDDPGILLTLTAGGNDLLDALAAGQPLDREVAGSSGVTPNWSPSCWRSCPRPRWCSPRSTTPPTAPAACPASSPPARLPLEYLDRFNQTCATWRGERRRPAGRRAPALPRARRDRARARSLVLAAEPDRAERARRERDPAGVAGDHRLACR